MTQGIAQLEPAAQPAPTGKLGPARAAGQHSASGGAPLGADSDVWEVWWCYDGWHKAADRLEAVLPPWARLYRMDPARPLADQVRAARVLVPTTGSVTREVVMAARDLRLIAQPAAGYNNVDVAAAAERGVPVTTSPGVNARAVAEGALMLILMLSRRVRECERAFAARLVGEPEGRELQGRVLGIIGRGAIGGLLEGFARALGMEVISTTSKSTRADLEDLLRRSDVISVNCPLTARTRNLLGQREFATMKRGVLLVNCARGEVIDRSALTAALAADVLGGVALDVHWEEPPEPSDALYQDPRVIAMPHVTCATEDVYQRLAELLAENIVRCREGRPLLNQLAVADHR